MRPAFPANNELLNAWTVAPKPGLLHGHQCVGAEGFQWGSDTEEAVARACWHPCVETEDTRKLVGSCGEPLPRVPGTCACQACLLLSALCFCSSLGWSLSSSSSCQLLPLLLVLFFFILQYYQVFLLSPLYYKHFPLKLD